MQPQPRSCRPAGPSPAPQLRSSFSSGSSSRALSLIHAQTVAAAAASTLASSRAIERGEKEEGRVGSARERERGRRHSILTVSVRALFASYCNSLVVLHEDRGQQQQWATRRQNCEGEGGERDDRERTRDNERKGDEEKSEGNGVIHDDTLQRRGKILQAWRWAGAWAAGRVRGRGEGEARRAAATLVRVAVVFLSN